MTRSYERSSSDRRGRRSKRKQVRYLLLSLGLACLASAIFCLVLWRLGQPSVSSRPLDPSDLEQSAPVIPKR